MTREKAVEFGEFWLEMNSDSKASLTYQFFDVAIKALKQESCDDAISRAAVFDALRTCYDTEKVECENGGEYISYEQTVSLTEDLHPVTPQPKIGSWIPVSEKLPEEFVSVLVCFKSQGGMAQCVTERIVDFLDGSTRWSSMCGQVPIAWMPLPEPYKAEGEVEK